MDGLSAAQRFAVGLELSDLGIRIQRQNLRRAHAESSEAEIDRLLADWLAERPGAEFGDGEGRPAVWPRDPTA